MFMLVYPNISPKNPTNMTTSCIKQKKMEMSENPGTTKYDVLVVTVLLHKPVYGNNSFI